jgi:acyl-CoA hydrolase
LKEELQSRIDASITRTTKAIFPGITNHYDTLFGGTALQWMDEVAFITATRFSKKKMVTVSSDRIDFRKPIPEGTIVELIGKVMTVGKTSLKIRVEIYLEEMYKETKELALHGEFTLVCIDDSRKPCAVL